MKTPTLPTDAGGVQLHFVNNQRNPRRAEHDGTPSLYLPIIEGMEFHPLKNGEQFLVCYPGKKSRWSPEDRTFFGGMDESPFITSLKDTPLTAFQNNGEDAFYESLIPDVVKLMKKVLPDTEVRRQGDVWSVALPFSWENLPGISQGPKLVNVSGRRRTRLKQRKQNLPALSDYQARMESLRSEPRFIPKVLDTRNHSIKGRYVVADHFTIMGKSMANFKAALGEGILRAPDHAELELLGRAHLLARTPHITPTNQYDLQGSD
jgi:hypothetical protein